MYGVAMTFLLRRLTLNGICIEELFHAGPLKMQKNANRPYSAISVAGFSQVIVTDLMCTSFVVYRDDI